MHPDEIHVVTTWRVEATCGEVADVLRDPVDLVRWWPAAWTAVEPIDGPDDRGLGERVRLRAKGWLPGALHLELVVTESRYPSRFALDVSGDLRGQAAWSLEQDGATAVATLDWRVRVTQPALAALAPVMRPLLAANHRWAMTQGEESLRLELARRRATSAPARAAVPPPPGPVTYAAAGLVAGAALVGGTLAYLMLTRGRRS